MKLKFLAAAIFATCISATVLADGEHGNQVKTSQLSSSI